MCLVPSNRVREPIAINWALIQSPWLLLRNSWWKIPITLYPARESHSELLAQQSLATTSPTRLYNSNKRILIFISFSVVISLFSWDESFKSLLIVFQAKLHMLVTGEKEMHTRAPNNKYRKAIKSSHCGLNRIDSIPITITVLSVLFLATNKIFRYKIPTAKYHAVAH